MPAIEVADLSAAALEARTHLRRYKYFATAGAQDAPAIRGVHNLVTGYLAIRQAIDASPFEAAAPYAQAHAYLDGFALRAGAVYAASQMEEANGRTFSFHARPNIGTPEFNPNERKRAVLESVLKDYGPVAESVAASQRGALASEFVTYINGATRDQQLAIPGHSALEKIASSYAANLDGTAVGIAQQSALGVRKKAAPTPRAISAGAPREYTPPAAIDARPTGATFEEIVGNHELKRALLSACRYLASYDPATKSNALAESFDLPFASSMLVYGPPGTGKTTLLNAAQNYAIELTRGRSPLAVVEISGSFKSIYYSGSAGNIDALFEPVKQGDRPYLIRIDDFDTIFFSRDKTGHSPEDTANIGAILRNIDELIDTGFRNYFIVSISNQPSVNDAALLRRLREKTIFAPGIQTAEEYSLAMKNHIPTRYLHIDAPQWGHLGNEMRELGLSGGDVKNIATTVTGALEGATDKLFEGSAWLIASPSERARIAREVSKGMAIEYRHISQAVRDYTTMQRQESEREREKRISSMVDEMRIREAAIGRLEGRR